MHEVVFVPFETVHVRFPHAVTAISSYGQAHSHGWWSHYVVNSLSSRSLSWQQNAIFALAVSASLFFLVRVWGECLFDYHSGRAGWKSLISSSVQYGNSSLLSQEASPFLPSFFCSVFLFFCLHFQLFPKLILNAKAVFSRHYHFKFSLERIFSFCCGNYSDDSRKDEWCSLWSYQAGNCSDSIASLSCSAVRTGECYDTVNQCLAEKWYV